MADLDKETIEAANKAFDAEVAKLDEWASSMDAATTDSAAQETQKPDETEPETESERETEAEPENDEPNVETNNAATHKLTRDEAKKLVLHDYDSFADIVSNGDINFAKLAEYTSVIIFWFKSFKTGKEKQGQLYKYPKFLELFKVKTASEISIADVLKKFAPEEYQKSMEIDHDLTRRSIASAEIIERGNLSMDRKLDATDYDILRKHNVKNPEQYKTVADVLGTSMPDFNYYESDDVKYTYNSDYAAAMRSMTGEDTTGHAEEISMDDVMAGVDMDLFNRMTGCGPKSKTDSSKKPDRPPLNSDSEDTGEPDQPFIPFD